MTILRSVMAKAGDVVYMSWKRFTLFVEYPVISKWQRRKLKTNLVAFTSLIGLSLCQDQHHPPCKGYRYERVHPSVRSFVQVVSQRLFIESCSVVVLIEKKSKMVKIIQCWIFMRTSMCTFVQGVSQILFIWTVFKLRMVILQILKLCNIVVWMEKNENCQNHRIVKIYEYIFDSCPGSCPSCFSKTIYRIASKIHILLLQIFKMCKVVVLIKEE